MLGCVFALPALATKRQAWNTSPTASTAASFGVTKVHGITRSITKPFDHENLRSLKVGSGCLIYIYILAYRASIFNMLSFLARFFLASFVFSGKSLNNSSWQIAGRRRNCANGFHSQNNQKHLSHEKKPLTFHYTGCLIGILIMVQYNSHMTG